MIDETSVDYSDHYRTWHDDTPEHAEEMARYTRSVLEPTLVGAARGRALDLGCGFGFALLALGQLGFEAEGIDIDPGQVAVARAHGLAAELVTDSLEYLQERPGSFVLVTMLDTLEHLPVVDQVPLLRGVRDSLAPSGRLVLTVPNASALGAARWRYNDPTHHNSFTEHSIRFALRSAGFATVQVLPSAPLRRPSLRVWRAGWADHFRATAVRWAWRQALIAQFGDEGRQAPMDLNLTVVASG